MNLIVLPSQLDDMPAAPPCNIAGGIIPKTGLVGVVAQAGAGKTFATLSMSLAMAAGRPWFGYETESTGVLYVVGEGFPGMRSRVRAWCDAHGIEPKALDSRIGFCRVPFDISDADMCQRILEALKEQQLTPDVIVIDTLSANGPPGFNENDTADMKIVMDSARRLRDTYQWAVVIVHHMGHNATRERGNTDFRGALDTMLYLTVDKAHRVLSMPKSRDFMPIEPMRFQLTPCGDSAVLTLDEPAKAVPRVVTRKISPAHQKTLATLQTMRETGSGGRATDWEEATGKANGTFYRHLEALKEAAFVEETTDGYVLTARGKRVLEDPMCEWDEPANSHSHVTPIHSQMGAHHYSHYSLPALMGGSSGSARRARKGWGQAPGLDAAESDPGYWRSFETDIHGGMRVIHGDLAA